MPVNQLIAATTEDRIAKREALQAGLLASMPLTVVRLAQLCELGERMMRTALRKSDAERDLQDATIHRPRQVDVLLPR